MHVMVELSLYPLVNEYISPIQDFIDRLNSYTDITVSTSSTSTQVTGEYGVVMKILGDEMQRTHEAVGQAIFVAKFLNFDAMQARKSS
ncbi:hypothetical protein D210916BOD24_21970 [Alteromonas sp. D210916BOD_24]|uniref:hypothetical protein n=1 Tax=Alteromonas sp. D210916BOD_24 TaxID=3157618 RepID=UPI00399CD034